MFSRAASRAIGHGIDYGIARVERVVNSRKLRIGGALTVATLTYLAQERRRRLKRIEEKLDAALQE